MSINTETELNGMKKISEVVAITLKLMRAFTNHNTIMMKTDQKNTT